MTLNRLFTIFRTWSRGAVGAGIRLPALAAVLTLLPGCGAGAVASNASNGYLNVPTVTENSNAGRATESIKNPHERIVYKFTINQAIVNGLDGLVYANGKFYGTSAGGGGDLLGGRFGIVFSLTPNANFTSLTETTLYIFKGLSDGCYPKAGVIVVGSTLYGTASQCGSTNNGVVFSLPITGGSESVLYSFGGLPDSVNPGSALLQVGNYLYGTAGGGAWNLGTVYRVPIRGGSDDVLYSFVGQPDGFGPVAPVINVGNYLYGTTEYGGANGYYGGTVFRVPIAGGSDTILYSFSNPPTSPSYIRAGLLNVGSYLYGTTQGSGSTGNGMVFRVPLGGGSETTLHSFQDGTDGADPMGPVRLIDGQLYGTTFAGGASNCGTVYQVPLDGGSDSVVYAFTTQTRPAGSVIDVDGDLYGVASSGGYSFGTVFKL